jgi:restriction endonuclease
MPAISLTFGDTVKSYPVLDNSTSRKVQKRIKDILTKTANEVLRELRIPGKDYNDRTTTAPASSGQAGKSAS